MEMSAGSAEEAHMFALSRLETTGLPAIGATKAPSPINSNAVKMSTYNIKLIAIRIATLNEPLLVNYSAPA
jgi:hypothetical protein